ncbi:MAG: hypothetical protein KC466_17160 [Myxococcales bacterium]|nr:hypothetical protein [Myxococcales bacterium]
MRTICGIPRAALILATIGLSIGCTRGPCDDSNPLVCAFPWPSDRYLAEDPTTETGYRLEYEQGAAPTNTLNQPVDLSPYRRLDGMSPASQLMTLFDPAPNLAASGAASQWDIGRSLDADSPTVILDLTTGERVAHWTELDVQAESSAEQVLYLRPANRLAENHAYGVAIRGLVDDVGQPIAPHAPFAMLRDGQQTGSIDLEMRRGRFESLFATLEANGIPRGTLQEAWQFHTASGTAIRGDLLAMRADALARLGPDGIGCAITSVSNNRAGQIWRYVEGTVTVPSYMSSSTPPARLARGPDGTPVFQEYVEVPFVANLPATLAEAPGGPVAGPLVTFGHGLLGSAKGSIDKASVRDLANRFGVVVAGTNWAGMSTDDLIALGILLLNASEFPTMTERLQQGMINQIALTRSLAGVCRALPELGAGGTPLIDPGTLWYAGGSQGGIYGGTLLALSPDIDRGALFVDGAAYGLMLDRSTAFRPSFQLLVSAYPRRIDRALILPLAQHLWDATDPASYLPFLASGLPGIGPKEVLSIVAENDAQVPPVSGDLAARMAGLPVVAGSAREPWGLAVQSAPFAGSAFVSIDVGDPTVPAGNEPPPVDSGAHGEVPFTDTSLSIAETFLRDGVVTMPCTGVCDPD